MSDNASETAANPPVANLWRGELTVEVPGKVIRLRCSMDVLARLLEVLGCKTLLEVTKLWDGLNPDIMAQTLRLLAEQPSEADAFFPHVNGLSGLQTLHVKFYRIISGMTPDQIAEDEEHRKKLTQFLADKTAEEIGMIVAALKLT